MTATTLTLTLPDKLDEALARLDAVMPTTAEAGTSAEWLSVNEVAEITGAAPRTVRRWIADGRLPSVKVAGRTIRIHRADLAATMQPRTPTETPPAAAIAYSHCTCPCREAAAAAKSQAQTT